MAFNAEQINIILSAQTKDLRDQLAKAERRIKGFENRTRGSVASSSKSFDMLGAAAKRMGPLLVGAFSLQALQNASNLSRELVNLSNLTGVGVERFQEMSFAAQQMNISQEKLADILKDVNDKVGDFMQTGAGPMADFFENIAPKVGITADAFRDLTSADALQLYVDSLEKAGVSQQEMTFYMEALASDASMLTPLLADNGAEMGNLAEKARALGIVLDEDLVRQTAQMDKVWSTVMTSMSANFTAFAMHVINGFDNIFGITNYGQMSIVQRQINDLTDEALNLNAAINEANVAGTNVLNTDEFSGVNGQGVTTVEAATQRLEKIRTDLEAATAEKEELQVLLDKLENASVEIQNTPSIGSAGGGGGSTADDVEKIRDAFTQLMGSLDDAVKANNDFAAAQATVNAALSAGIITTEEATLAMSLIARRLAEAKGEAIDLSSVADTMKSSMESAFMAMVDGTMTAKDAFRAMAADIIKELYRVLVVQQLVGSFETGGGGILGALAPIFGRASGGTVQAGQPYMTGESGRELFVPKTDGRILSPSQTMNISKGGGDSVTVVQNNTFGNGVNRAEINAMLPKLVEASKAAVLDAKRRGGSYGGAF
jgi:hypothetical protein